MRTKDMTKEQALKAIELLKHQIEFNNKLNAFVRKFRKEHNIGHAYEDGKVQFNGYWDEPTSEMKEAMKSILLDNAIEDLSWMPNSMKKRYAEDCNHIFGQVYSCAVNTYLLKDLHDCEKYIETFDNAQENNSEENELFRVERDTETNRINLYFDGIPSAEVRSVIKHNGFRWSPNYKCWTRQLTSEAELSLNRIKKELSL